MMILNHSQQDLVSLRYFYRLSGDKLSCFLFSLSFVFASVVTTNVLQSNLVSLRFCLYFSKKTPQFFSTLWVPVCTLFLLVLRHQSTVLYSLLSSCFKMAYDGEKWSNYVHNHIQDTQGVKTTPFCAGTPVLVLVPQVWIPLYRRKLFCHISFIKLNFIYIESGCLDHQLATLVTLLFLCQLHGDEQTLWTNICSIQQLSIRGVGGGSARKRYPLGHRYMKGEGFYQLKFIKGEGNLSFPSVKRPKRANRRTIYGCEKVEKISQFCEFFIF